MKDEIDGHIGYLLQDLERKAAKLCSLDKQTKEDLQRNLEKFTEMVDKIEKVRKEKVSDSNCNHIVCIFYYVIKPLD